MPLIIDVRGLSVHAGYFSRYRSSVGVLHLIMSCLDVDSHFSCRYTMCMIHRNIVLQAAVKMISLPVSKLGEYEAGLICRTATIRRHIYAMMMLHAIRSSVARTPNSRRACSSYHIFRGPRRCLPATTRHAQIQPNAIALSI